ncbi:hypothetical protein CVS40_11128 [Lucilia cuprina]|nr:hypothetical protein CVS40_11128 [Lucilia cuprina]
MQCPYKGNLWITWPHRKLMNEIFEMERNVDWSGVTYLSPIGILGAPARMDWMRMSSLNSTRGLPPARTEARNCY